MCGAGGAGSGRRCNSHACVGIGGPQRARTELTNFVVQSLGQATSLTSLRIQEGEVENRHWEANRSSVSDVALLQLAAQVRGLVLECSGGWGGQV